MYDNKQLQEISTQVRRDILRMVCSAKSGHPGGSMSSTDILTTLYFNVMKQDPATWTREGKGQDMFILSAGHMTPVYYSVLSRAGYFPVSELASFRQFGARLQGHPSIRKGLPGVFQASGSLGQGLSAACGLAIGKAYELAKAGKGSGVPTMILFKSEMGHGVDFMAGTHKWHGSVPKPEQLEDALKQLGETPLGDF